MEIPGVSLAVDPDFASRFSESSLTKDAGQDARPQVYQLWHRGERPAVLELDGTGSHSKAVGSLRDAFEGCHDAVIGFDFGTVPRGLLFVGGLGPLTDVVTPAKWAKSFVDMPEAATLDDVDGHR